MNCPNCNSENSESAKFCKKCGTPLKKTINHQNMINSISEGFSKIWDIYDVEDVSEYSSEMKMGDILVNDESFYIILDINPLEEEGEFDSITIVGINAAHEVLQMYYNGSEWNFNYMEIGTKIYKHEVKGIGAGGPPKIIVYDTDSSKITTSNVATRINNSISAITNSSKITFANISGTNLLLVYFGIIPPSSVNTQVSTSALSGYTDDVVTPL